MHQHPHTITGRRSRWVLPPTHLFTYLSVRYRCPPHIWQVSGEMQKGLLSNTLSNLCRIWKNLWIVEDGFLALVANLPHWYDHVSGKKHRIRSLSGLILASVGLFCKHRSTLTNDCMFPWDHQKWNHKCSTFVHFCLSFEFQDIKSNASSTYVCSHQ